MEINKYGARQKGNLKYHVRVYNEYTGKKDWVGSFRLEADAKLAGREYERRLALGELVPRRRQIGFSDLVDEWLEPLRSRRPRTVQDYEYTTKHLKAYFGNKLVATIGRADAEGLVAHLQKKGLGDNYIRKIKTRLVQILDYASRKSTWRGRR